MLWGGRCGPPTRPAVSLRLVTPKAPVPFVVSEECLSTGRGGQGQDEVGVSDSDGETRRVGKRVPEVEEGTTAPVFLFPMSRLPDFR